jgi:hypothetical protein
MEQIEGENNDALITGILPPMRHLAGFDGKVTGTVHQEHRAGAKAPNRDYA